MAQKTSDKPAEKPLKSRFFRVATEGATTDGRAITREQIEQMAKNFDPSKYGARVWVEHMRGLYADSPFRAHGDVLAVEARDVEEGINGKGIKSIQRGVIQMNGGTAAVTITAVDMSKAELRLTGYRVATLAMLPTVALTASNTITATRGETGVGGSYVAWELTEWK